MKDLSKCHMDQSVAACIVGQYRMLGLIVLLLSFSSCATVWDRQSSANMPSAIGPYGDFSGRLIVIEPARRWQVLLEWQAETAELGRVRLTHAATGTVVELQWQHEKIQVRDNKHPDWRAIGQQKLAELGIVIPLQQLASILLGKMPVYFKRKNDDAWESRQTGDLIRLHWQAGKRKLSLTDIKHGRQAMLFID
jgi:hypothetical protein